MTPPLPCAHALVPVGFLVGEDLWDEGQSSHPPADLLAAGAGLLVCLAASPYRRGVLAERLHHARRPAAPLAYANQWGAQDELIFDGRSFVLNGAGQTMAGLVGFGHEVRTVDLTLGSFDGPVTEEPRVLEEGEPDLYQALVLGVRDLLPRTRSPTPFSACRAVSTRRSWP